MSAEAPRASARQPASSGRYVSWAVGLLLLLAYLPALAGTDVLNAWSREDGPVESLGALAFLAAAIVFAAVYRLSRRGPQPWWTARVIAGHPGYLALCVVMFVVCMEEISWGQRILGIRTPEAIARVNRQRQLNLHNLDWFHGHDRNHQRKSAMELTHNMDRLFSGFNVLLGVLVPLAYRREKWRGALDRLGAPILPLATGLLFVGSYVPQQVPGALRAAARDRRDQGVQRRAHLAGPGSARAAGGARVGGPATVAAASAAAHPALSSAS